MDEQYYRKARQKSFLKDLVKGAWKNKTLRYMLIVAAPALFFMIFGNKGMLQRIRMENQKREMQEKIRETQQEQLQLQSQSKALDNDPRAIEKVAREKYGMIREGETVYKIRKEK